MQHYQNQHPKSHIFLEANHTYLPGILRYSIIRGQYCKNSLTKKRRIKMIFKEQNEMTYLPLFFSWYETVEELSDNDLGMLIKALLKSVSRGDTECNKSLPTHLKIAYNFMYDNVIRAMAGYKKMRDFKRENLYRRWGKKSESGQTCAQKTKLRHGDFDSDEAFKLALERSDKGVQAT